MKYYFYIDNNKINGKGQCEDDTAVEVSQEVYNDDIERYIWNGEEVIVNPDWPLIQLQKAKDSRVEENDIARDEALIAGVTYKGVLFDSDTDQKINLLSVIEEMSEEATTVWFGMDNTPLVCTKQDLRNIGGLIKALHTFCWTKNAEIKAEISYATTIEEVEAVVIDYNMSEEENES